MPSHTVPKSDTVLLLSPPQFYHYADSLFLPEMTPHEDDGCRGTALTSGGFMRNVIVCVAPDAVQRGIATRLNRLCTRHARAHNFRHVTSMCSSRAPEQLALSSGYRRHAAVDYRDYALRFGLRGDTLRRFLLIARDHGHARLMVQDL